MTGKADENIAGATTAEAEGREALALSVPLSGMDEAHQTTPADDAADGPKALSRYLLLFVLIFLGWGVLSPFLPAVLTLQGATPVEVGLLLGMGTALGLLAMPMAGSLADRLGAPREVLAVALIGAALSVICYGWARGGRAATAS